MTGYNELNFVKYWFQQIKNQYFHTYGDCRREALDIALSIIDKQNKEIDRLNTEYSKNCN